MNTISRTIAAFALTLADKTEADRLFSLARACEGHEAPRPDHFRAMQALLNPGGNLPETLPESGIYRKAFAARAAEALVRRVFDQPRKEDYAGLLRINAMALLAVVEGLPIEKVAQTIAPKAEAAPMFFEDSDGLHGGGTPNAIYLPGMVLTYTTIRSDKADRIELGIWLMNGQHAHTSVASLEEATSTLQAWVRKPTCAFAPQATAPSAVG